MSPEVSVGVVAALSEGQRAVAHLVVLLGAAVAVALFFLVRRTARRDEKTADPQGVRDEER
jgi:hypothetical protein